jgi:predicted ATPase/DNA-binding SARP family transcriptional activator
LLGIPQVNLDSQLIRGFKSRKALALLCYLAVRAQPVSRTQLAELFWGDKSESQGRANLSRVLNNLTTLFPGSIHATRDTLTLAPGVFSLDLEEFQDLAQQSSSSALQAAAALYHDEFMSGLYLDDCPEFEVWLVAERERWQQRFISVLDCLAGYFARREEPEKALPFAARMLEIEPWREEAHREMMQLLAQSGQRSAALQQFETARRVIGEELGVEPGAEMVALYEQIRAQELAPAPRVASKHNLPAQLTSFIGRETELARITARLNNPDCRLLTLVGPGGIGKTRLALEAAKDMLSSFRDGVFFVPLAPIGVRQIDLIVPAIVSSLEIRAAGTLEPRLQLLEYLREKKLLLFLDNFEHLLDGARLVIEVLQNAPNVKILATSREPLNVQAEWLTRVNGLHYPTSPQALVAGHESTHFSALQLFVERAQRVDESFELNSDTSPHVVRLAQIVEGMPLALELAASQMQTESVSDIRLQVETNLDSLATTMRDVETRHHSLRAVLDWSYGLLSEVEQTLFQRLSVFAGSWTLDAAELVCADEKLQASNVEGSLANLADKSFALRRESEGELRFYLLEPIRQYSQEKLMRSGEQDKVMLRHAEYYLKDSKAYPHEPEAHWLDRVEMEIDNLRAAQSWSQSNEMGVALRLEIAWSIAVYLIDRGSLIEAEDWLNNALESTNTLGASEARAEATLQFANALAGIGNYGVAASRFTDALKLFQELGNQSRYAWTLNRLGWLAREFGDNATARALLEESLLVFRELSHQRELGIVLVTLGEVFVMQEESAPARELIHEGLALARSIGDTENEFWALNHLAHVSQLAGEYDQADQLHQQSLGLCHEIAYRYGFSYVYHDMGLTALAQGDATLAMQHFRDAVHHFEQMGHLAGISWCLAGLAGAMTLQGEPERAVRIWSAAETLRASIGARHAPAARATHDRLITLTKLRLGDVAFTSAWALGSAMTTEQAIAYALANHILPP